MKTVRVWRAGIWVRHWRHASGTRFGMWPILPGLLPGAYFFHGANQQLELPCMALTTVLFVFAATFIGASRKWLLAPTACVVLGLSIVNSLIAYAAFRA